MTRAMSIHAGLNAVDGGHYRGWTGPLRGSEHDARAMHALAAARGFEAELLLAGDATRARLLDGLDRARRLGAGDLLLVTYSGHGASLADRTAGEPGGGDEPDGRDEVWCLHDGLLLDDEIHHRLCRLAAGVRVLVVSDSCFSGSVTRLGSEAKAGAAATNATSAAGARASETGARGRAPVLRDGSPGDRRFPRAFARGVYQEHLDDYTARKAAVAGTAAATPAAGIILLAACDDRATAKDGADHGYFTAALLATWDDGRFEGDHDAFFAAIKARMGASQVPVLFTDGAALPAFRAARPFTP